MTAIDPTTALIGAYPSLIRQGIFRGVDLNVLRDRFWRLESMRADDLRSPPQVRWRAWSSSWVSVLDAGDAAVSTQKEENT